MSITVACPNCSQSYTVDDKLAGKKARCKKCGQSFRMSDDVADAPLLEESDDVPALASAGYRPLLIGSAIFGFLILAIGAMFWIRGSPTPNLVGKWRGSPEVRQAVKEVTKTLAKGQPVNPLASGFAQAFVQKAADELLAVVVDFKKGGTAFYSGNTEIIGMPAASDGPWEIVRADDDILIIRMGPKDKSFEARLAFRDRNNFSFTRTDKPDENPISFTRTND
jgi:predicted Zn finger-like uncharacterized protein